MDRLVGTRNVLVSIVVVVVTQVKIVTEPETASNFDPQDMIGGGPVVGSTRPTK